MYIQRTVFYDDEKNRKVITKKDGVVQIAEEGAGKEGCSILQVKVRKVRQYEHAFACEAIRRNNEDEIGPEIIQAILETKPNFKSYAFGQNPLAAAAKKNDTKLVKYMLERGADPESVDFLKGKSALRYAVEHGNKEMIHMLINAGACPKQQYQGLNTPDFLADALPEAPTLLNPMRRTPYYMYFSDLVSKHRERNCWCRDKRKRKQEETSLDTTSGTPRLFGSWFPKKK